MLDGVVTHSAKEKATKRVLEGGGGKTKFEKGWKGGQAIWGVFVQGFPQLLRTWGGS